MTVELGPAAVYALCVPAHGLPVHRDYSGESLDQQVGVAKVEQRAWLARLMWTSHFSVRLACQSCKQVPEPRVWDRSQRAQRRRERDARDVQLDNLCSPPG